ncbi:MAG TPA: hypothetical protein VH880_03480 [Anaeromyxobacteraceae bacterium]|jgi:hypothetical protein
MSPAAPLALLATLGAGPAGSERLLLCRPVVRGEARLARADALPAAARQLGGRYLDYGVPCEEEAEAVRAARRAGLPHAVSATAEGRSDGSRFALTLSSAAEQRPVGRRELQVAPGDDAVAPLRLALLDLAEAAAPPPSRAGPWIAAGAGAAALASGGVLALLARSAASDRDRAGAAGDWRGYVEKDASWRQRRTAAGVAAGLGAAALAAGIAWRFAF